jgi:signal peptidase
LNIKIKIILAIVSVLAFVFFWPVQLGGDTEFLIVQGQSMLPTILPGSMVIIKEAPSYQIDDIVAFTQREGSAQKIVVHRIIDETEDGFVIKGDNNPKKDPGFPKIDDIRGKVLFATPYVGYIMVLLRNPMVLIVTAIVMGAIQMEQNRRKKHKEKLRKIRLGLHPMSQDTSNQSQQKKPKKPNYTMFFAAIAFNVITYFALQFSIASGIKPEGDMVTGFLFKLFIPTFASTLSFALYFLFIFGLYFVAKYYEAKSYRANVSTLKKSGSVQMLVGNKSNHMLGIASFMWILFVLLSLYHLLAIYNDLLPVLS